MRPPAEKSIGEAVLVGTMLTAHRVSSEATAAFHRAAAEAEAVVPASMTLAHYFAEEPEVRLRFLRTPLVVTRPVAAPEVRAPVTVGLVAQDTSVLLCFRSDLIP